ncbi:hypothetical protein ACI2I2_22450 [Scandinavium sp. NPDC088450]|uniref:hypothetical protein n=1 Tax=Scandinavium sp. NPDC088450 TaxID=3364514 RepID=UPI00384AC999
MSGFALACQQGGQLAVLLPQRLKLTRYCGLFLTRILSGLYSVLARFLLTGKLSVMFPV